jgi:hypothetical protein
MKGFPLASAGSSASLSQTQKRSSGCHVAVEDLDPHSGGKYRERAASDRNIHSDLVESTPARWHAE